MIPATLILLIFLNVIYWFVLINKWGCTDQRYWGMKQACAATIELILLIGLVYQVDPSSFQNAFSNQYSYNYNPDYNYKQPYQAKTYTPKKTVKDTYAKTNTTLPKYTPPRYRPNDIYDY